MGCYDLKLVGRQEGMMWRIADHWNTCCALKMNHSLCASIHSFMDKTLTSQPEIRSEYKIVAPERHAFLHLHQYVQNVARYVKVFTS